MIPCIVLPEVVDGWLDRWMLRKARLPYEAFGDQEVVTFRVYRQHSVNYFMLIFSKYFTLPTRLATNRQPALNALNLTS